MLDFREFARNRSPAWAALCLLAGLVFGSASAGAQAWRDVVGAENPNVARQIEVAPEPKEMAGAGPQWRAELEAERARNADRIRAIDEQAAPLGRELNQVLTNIRQHNANAPSLVDPNNRSQVQAYNAKVVVYNEEANRLNGRRAELVNILTPMAQESDRLIARNKQIDTLLKQCVQVPIACSSDADCTCSHSCGLMAGPLGNTKLCQPAH